MTNPIHLRMILGMAAALILASGAQALSPPATDWPQWRGPDRTGVSPETGWSATGKAAPRWNRELGFGHSSFAVAEGRVFTMGYDVERKLDVVYCLDAETGEQRWTHEYPAEYWNEGHDGGTCTTPAISGDTVYVSNREGNVFAIDAETGRVRWHRNLAGDHQLTPPQWGFAGSPVPIGETLFLNMGRLAALDRATGETRWLSAKHYGTAYSTPVEFEYLGTPSMLVLNGEGLAVVDRADGRELASHAFARNPMQATLGATPIVVEGRIFISGAHGGGCALLEPTASGLEVVWESRLMRTTRAGCVLYENHLYGFDQSILKCIDLEGNETWRQRGIGLGGLSIVGGRLVVLGAKGEIVIAEANPEAFIELSRRKALEGGENWSTPVLSHGLLYARNSLGNMVCLDHRGDDATRETRADVPTERPSGSALLARHVQAMGGLEALDRMRSARFTGRGEAQGAGPVEQGDASLCWTAAGSIRLRLSSGYEYCITPERGWHVSQHGAEMLDADTMNRLREALDLHRVLAGELDLQSLETVGDRVFDDRHCYVVDATRSDGARRTLYFESATGRLAGLEGESIALWVYGDYREHDGLTLPMSIAAFWPGSGSMTMAAFDGVVLNDVEPHDFDPPEIIRFITRTAAEKAEANERLQAEYGHLVGRYRLATGNMTGTPVNIIIREGGIQYSFGGSRGPFLKEPDAHDRLQDWTNPIHMFQLDRDEAGEVTGIRFFVQGVESGRLERVDE